MKKFLAFFSLSIFMLMSLGVIPSFATNENEAVIVKNIILKKREIEKVISKGKTYIQALDTYFETYQSNPEKINVLVKKVSQAKLKLGSSQKEQEIKLLIEYIEYKFLYVTNGTVDIGYTGIYDDSVITVLYDATCKTCYIDNIIKNIILAVPSLGEKTIKYIEKKELGVNNFLIQNEISQLPVIVFNDKKIEYDRNQIIPFLKEIPNGQYVLNISGKTESTINIKTKEPTYIKLETLNNLKKSSHLEWDINSDITMITYGAINEPFTNRQLNSDIYQQLSKKYDGTKKIGYIFKHYPLSIIDDSIETSQLLECGDKQGINFYNLLHAGSKYYAESDSNIAGFKKIIVELGADSAKLDFCESQQYVSEILGEMELGVELFDITGTPTNIIVNNTTGEYEIVSGAYPVETFVTVIERMLAE